MCRTPPVGRSPVVVLLGETDDGILHRRVEVVGADVLEESTVLEVAVDKMRRPSHTDAYPSAPEVDGDLVKGACRRVVDVGDAVGVEHECVDWFGSRVEDLTHASRDMGCVSVPERRVEQIDDDSRDLLGGLPTSAGIQ